VLARGGQEKKGAEKESAPIEHELRIEESGTIS